MTETIWLNRSQAAEIIGVSMQTISTMASQNMGPISIKQDRYRVWSKESVEQYAAERAKKRDNRKSIKPRHCRLCGQTFRARSSVKTCPACSGKSDIDEGVTVSGPLYSKYGIEMRAVQAKCPMCKAKYIAFTATWQGSGLLYKFCPKCEPNAARARHYRDNHQLAIDA